VGRRVIVDTILINGTAVDADPRIVVERRDPSFGDFHKDGPYRGENLTIPGMPGQVSFAKVRDAYVMDLPIVVLGSDRTDFIDALADLRTLIGADNLVTLTRRLTNGVSYTDATCDAEYLANQAVDLLNPETGRTTLSFLNLSGGWS
jgi:hypothetical protein